MNFRNITRYEAADKLCSTHQRQWHSADAPTTLCACQWSTDSSSSAPSSGQQPATYRNELVKLPYHYHYIVHTYLHCIFTKVIKTHSMQCHSWCNNRSNFGWIKYRVLYTLIQDLIRLNLTLNIYNLKQTYNNVKNNFIYIMNHST